jgi:mono/diheme cytochrome c family protein
MGSMGRPGGGMMGPATPRGGGAMVGRRARQGRGTTRGPGMGQSGRMMGGMMQGGGMTGSSSLSTVPAESLPETGGSGAQLVASYCSRCHGIPSPALHGAAEWPAVVGRMEQQMRSNGAAVPDSGETAAIIAYLQAHAHP